MLLHTANSLASLITALERLDFDCAGDDVVEHLLRASRVERAELLPYTRFEDGRYTRNLIFRNGDFELLLLCWAPGAATPVHDHGGSRCSMLVHSGLLRVDDYVLCGGGRRSGFAHVAPTALTTLLPGAVDARNARRDLHRVSAPREPAISLHVYAKPVGRYTIFTPEDRSCRKVFAHYDSMPEPAA